jgi:RNA polymerase sigma factor (sigma-70 family)
MKKTQPTVGIVGPLITTYQSSHSDRQFSKILDCFSPRIRDIAGTFPKDWNEDYYQEGSIGLYQALTRGPVQLPVPEFILYATRAIRAKMIDFYRSTVGKFLMDVAVDLEDGTSLIVKQPCIVRYPDRTGEEGEFDLMENYTPLPEYAATLELSVDLAHLLAVQQLKQLSLTDPEIQVVNLYYKQGYNTTAVSHYLHTSVSNASKLIGKANAKLKPYLLNYHIK